MITINRSPEKISPAFNAIEFELISDEQARTDFRYKVEVKDGSGVVLNTSYYYGGPLAGSITAIDVSGPLHRLQTFNHWRRDVQPTAFIYSSSGFRVTYSVTISEEYDGTLHDVENITGLYTIPAALPSIKRAFYDYDLIKTAGRWLTNFTSMNVRRTDKLTLSYLQPETATLTGFNIVTYSASGVQVHNITQANPLSANVEDVIHLHSGPEEIASMLGISLSSVYYYDIIPAGGQSIRVLIEEDNCRHAGARLHYLNEWGAVDSFTFGLAVRRSSTIEKKKAKLPFAGSFLRPSIFGVGPSPYVVTYTDALKLSSGWITDEDSNALLELFTSPIASVEVPKNLFMPDTTGAKIVIPCEIDIASYEIKKKNIEKLFNLEIDIKLSVDNTRQSL